MWKSKNFQFPVTETFWDVLWHSDSYRSRALIIRKKFCCNDMCLDKLLLFRETMKQFVGVFKKAFLEVPFWVQIPMILRCLIRQENHVFTISQKNVENNTHNVYIFLMGDARASQNRFNHVHTTYRDNSRGSQLGGSI